MCLSSAPAEEVRYVARWRTSICFLLIAIVGYFGFHVPPSVIAAQNSNDEPASQPTDDVETDEPSEEDAAPPKVYDEATDVGIRMTPAIAKAISSRMTEQMKQRYELDDGQTEKVTAAIEQNIMKLSHENATVGRDAIEMMMATMIRNDGEFTRDTAIEFAKQVKPLIPALRGFFENSARDVGKAMTLKQRLRFTGDMTALTAGVGIFEERMKRWEAGQVSDGANPFFDRPGDNDEEAADADPNEPREVQQARRRVDRSMQWTINVEGRWDQYVRNAILFYDFDESQQTAANGILEDCKKRATAVKTEDWLADYRRNRIADQLSWGLDSKYNNGPFKYQLERAYERMMKPLNDIEKDLKKRIETLPNSKQRAAARRAAEKALQEKGLDKLPL